MTHNDIASATDRALIERAKKTGESLDRLYEERESARLLRVRAPDSAKIDVIEG